ncbi:MAG TPA: VanZ family protein [Candidatus Gallacutalibacter pullicola]|uniref:VanZ family protein n=1 Tax=Candidatus Gallacutalibacter pullicola TaxID=2840830 RepID=A0A9D1DQ98_9FIRM|nr:VanZ family protein [Candidatus Gallacutalibacter pullicola]
MATLHRKDRYSGDVPSVRTNGTGGGSQPAAAGKYQRVLRILFPAATVLFVLFIFGNSLQNGTESGSRSGFVVQLLENMLGFFGLKVEITEFFIRKSAHFAEYFVLGMLLFATLRVYVRQWKDKIFIPLFFGLLVPVCDEFLQLFVPGRSGQVSDVVLDFSGVLTGIGVLIVIFTAVSKRRPQKKLP